MEGQAHLGHADSALEVVPQLLIARADAHAHAAAAARRLEHDRVPDSLRLLERGIKRRDELRAGQDGHVGRDGPSARLVLEAHRSDLVGGRAEPEEAGGFDLGGELLWKGDDVSAGFARRAEELMRTSFSERKP